MELANSNFNQQKRNGLVFGQSVTSLHSNHVDGFGKISVNPFYPNVPSAGVTYLDQRAYGFRYLRAKIRQSPPTHPKRTKRKNKCVNPTESAPLVTVPVTDRHAGKISPRVPFLRDCAQDQTSSATDLITAEVLDRLLYGNDLIFDGVVKSPLKSPPGLEIRSLRVGNDTSHGVFSTLRLEAGIRFGPYAGKKVCLSEVKSRGDNSRMWEIFVKGQLSHFVDGAGPLGNWMASVRCARMRDEQNLVVIQNLDEIFYETCDVIQPESELLVWYGQDYDLYLGVPVGLKLTGRTECLDVTADTKSGLSSDNGYQCTRCGRVFTYSYYRDKHTKYTRCVDHGDRQFRCLLCPRSFEKKDRLRIHVLHVHQKIRPHTCNVCQKSFSQSSSLRKHLRVHSGERPYLCVYCGKSFTASSILRTHIRQHSGERPFRCKICGKSFASHAAHDSHVRRTHGKDNMST